MKTKTKPSAIDAIIDSDVSTGDALKRLQTLKPLIMRLTKIGFNVPLEVGGFRTPDELLAHVASCDEDEFAKTHKFLKELNKVYSA